MAATAVERDLTLLLTGSIPGGEAYFGRAFPPLPPAPVVAALPGLPREGGGRRRRFPRFEDAHRDSLDRPQTGVHTYTYIYIYIYIYKYIHTDGTQKTLNARVWPWLCGESP